MDKKEQQETQVENAQSPVEPQTPTQDADTNGIDTKSPKEDKPVNDNPSLTQAPIASVTTTKTASSWRVRLSILVSLAIAGVSLGAAYYLYQRVNEQQSQTLALKNQFNQALVRPKQQILELEKSQLKTSALKQEVKQLTKEQALLNDRVKVLAQRNPNHWMAAEADYLVQMAGRKLWLEKDPQTAASLLQAADERIAAMKDPALIQLRKDLAKDIAAVKAIKGTDIAGTVFTLDEIIASLNTLPVNRNDTLPEPIVEDDKLSDSIDDWRSNLAKSWKSVMEEFIVIRHRTTDLAPLLEPDQQWYLLENIRNKLLQSQLALYRFDEVNYRQSILVARNWIQQYFDLNSELTQDTLKALDALATLKVTKVTLSKFSSTAKLKQLTTYGELLEQDEGSTL